nr:alcohol dehydrogenase catalytic domain-containing protein [Salinispora cortesiana]
MTSFGGPEVLTLTEVASPQAGPGQLRVRVRSAGVNHFDTAIRKGWAPPTVDNSFPVVPGNEYAGVVDQVGEGVAGHSGGHRPRLLHVGRHLRQALPLAQAAEATPLDRDRARAGKDRSSRGLPS